MADKYYCTKCKKKHQSGEIYKEHRQYAGNELPESQVENRQSIEARLQDSEKQLKDVTSQLKEVTSQLISLRDVVMRNIEPDANFNADQVLKEAKRLSRGKLTSFDELQRVFNPDKTESLDKKLREYLIQLMDENKITMQEMKSVFKVSLRTDIFGGFKA